MLSHSLFCPLLYSKYNGLLYKVILLYIGDNVLEQRDKNKGIGRTMG